MQPNDYVGVKTYSEDEVIECKNKKMESKYFLRQLLVSSGIWISYFMSGLVVGSPTVIIPQLRREANSTEIISTEMASWLSSAAIYAALPWAMLLSALTGSYGRKRPQIFVNIIALIGCIVFYTSNSPNQLLISYTILGLLLGCQITISIVVIPEYTSPTHRGWLLPVKSATFAWGLWVSNALGTFFYWKWIPILAVCCAIYNLITISFWPESPIWLASKGQFDKCAKSHKWLRGMQENSMDELENLISNQKKYITHCENNTEAGFLNQFNNFCRAVSAREFYKSSLLSLTAISLYHCSGKLVCCVYALDIIKKICNNESTAYIGMLILDGVTVTSMYIGCALSKNFKRRTLLLTFSCIGITFLYILFLYLYLISRGALTENTYVSISLLSAFSVSVSCGPLIIVSTINSEIIPVRYRNFSICLNGAYFQTLLGTLLKVAPSMFKAFNLYGTFLFYAVSSSVFTLILYFYLPETKGKTTEEIENCMKKK